MTRLEQMNRLNGVENLLEIGEELLSWDALFISVRKVPAYRFIT